MVKNIAVPLINPGRSLSAQEEWSRLTAVEAKLLTLVLSLTRQMKSANERDAIVIGRLLFAAKASMAKATQAIEELFYREGRSF